MKDNKDRKIHHTFCRICEVLCGLEVTTENNEIVSVVPDKDHIATNGFACPKGLKQHLMYQSPDRVKYPMKRDGETWQRISWDQALTEIGARVAAIRQQHHADAIAMYVGTAAGFSVLHPIFAQGFMTGIGSVSMFSSSTQDCSNKFAVAGEMYGHPFVQPFPDLHAVNCLIVVGANPLISKWSFLQVPDPKKKLKNIIDRGGRIYVVDPRKTETAHAVGDHVFIRPGTDVFFYLSFLHEVIVRKGFDEKHVHSFMTGFDSLFKIAAVWPASRTAEVTGIEPEMLKKMVGDYLSADGAALYCSTGVNMGESGSLGYWLQECINAITGNLDRFGGTLVGKGIIDFPKFAKKNGILTRTMRSRVGNCRSVNDAFPGGILADEILTPGDRKVRALFVTGGNPLITMPDSNRLKQAFQELELLVAIDILPTETASLAHYILPATTPLERPDLPFIFPLMLGMQMNPYLQATGAVIESAEEQRDEASIYLDLCKYSGISIFKSRLAQILLELFSKRKTKNNYTCLNVPQAGILNLLLRICGERSFAALLKYPHGIRRPNHTTDFLTRRMLTDDKKVNLAPEILLEAVAALETKFETEKTNWNRFKLITKRAVKTHNSWTHNLASFVEPPEHTNYLYILPEDASPLSLTEGDYADVTSDTGSVRVLVRFSHDLSPKTVALPHGWGHQHSGLNVARRTQGVNVNILAPAGPENVDHFSGMALLTGIYVNIEKSDDKPKISSWSGR